MNEKELWMKMDKQGFGYTLVSAIPDNIDNLVDESDGTSITELVYVYIEKQGSWEVEGFIDITVGCSVAWYQEGQPKTITQLSDGSICVTEWH